MVIRVSEIPEEGLQIEGVAEFPRPFLDPSWILRDISLKVEKDGDTVFVTGALEAAVPQYCGRCLESYTVAVEPMVNARFVPAPQGRGEERELGSRGPRDRRVPTWAPRPDSPGGDRDDPRPADEASLPRGV